ncbi:SGNH/GDSL hydrolase family protein (plasmid) [Bradyrhizobium sp. PMVTL-01]|uniref:SGNH/GDSL hydrolase family protein n=1 Tax=Bradyrhizobium sp. PMVTL-01 TaxID=3434999 RepID=UPI003F71C806
MFDKSNKIGVLTGSRPLIALAIAAVLGVGGPASAQFFNFGGFQQRPPPQRGGGGFGGWFGNDTFSPFQQPAPQPRWERRRVRTPVREDFSRAPPPEKRDTVPERNVLVLGDAMADWLAYGLEDAYAEQPAVGVIRKVKTISGLIQYQPKGAPADWTAAARNILANEKPDVIVVMLGLSDRMAIREPAAQKSDEPADKKSDKSARKPDKKPADAKSKENAGNDAAKPDGKAADSELAADDAENADAPRVALEKSTRSPNGISEFRDDRWGVLYSKKIDEMIAVVKSKGVPVVWVGLPAILGQKSTLDMLFLDALYRDAAGRAGITYVDIWDGFVDETGALLQKGPDFEGQIRQLRTSDGVYFTKPGARKLAHYVEREISRLLAARSGTIALPTEPAIPDSKVAPGQPAPRPLAGPVVPLVAATINSDQLLGGPEAPPAAVDALAARVMIKGEPLSPPAGRADDFTWPRREVETPVASASGLGDVRAQMTAPAASLKPKKHRR